MIKWDAERIEGLRNQGEGEARALALIEAAALLYLDCRDNLLCGLSAEDQEWSLESPSMRDVQDMASLAQIMKDRAGSCVEEGETDWLVFGVLNSMAESHGYTKIVNWSLNLPDSKEADTCR